MRYLKALVLGSVAAAVLAGAAVATLSAVAASGAVDDLRVAAWTVVLVEVETAGGVTETTIGPGMGLLALVGGLVNVAVLALLVRRGGEGDPIA